MFADADVLTFPQIRLSVTLEDLTMYVAQRADKEKESILRQLSAPINSVKAKLGGMEGTLAGFQRTMHLVLSEVDADRERASAIEVSGNTMWVVRGMGCEHEQFFVCVLRYKLFLSAMGYVWVACIVLTNEEQDTPSFCVSSIRALA